MPIVEVEEPCDYRDAEPTGCPFQRFDRGYGRAGAWLAIVAPPCRWKVCGQNLCHNFGKPFKPSYLDRFIVVNR